MALALGVEARAAAAMLSQQLLLRPTREAAC
jgi:hypothetical protein